MYLYFLVKFFISYDKLQTTVKVELLSPIYFMYVYALHF
jgi:hypothetical protein